MIYYLLYPYAEEWHLANVLRYVPFRVLCATMTAMLLSFGLYPWFIRSLQKKQIGQVVRQEGLESHLSKAGTPTMGGALMLLALVLSTVLWADPSNAMVWVVTAITSAFGVVGYIDDAAKVRKKDTGGLAGRYKLLFQFSVCFAICGWLFYGNADMGLPADWLEIRHRLAFPFVKFETVEALTARGETPFEMPPWLYVLFASFVIVGTSNGVNLTDGLDGLAIGPVMINAAVYAVLAYLAGVVLFERSMADYLFIPHLTSASELSIYCASVVGVGFGFLWFNTYPAQVFMGDVGSLALGGGLGALAVCTKNEFLSVVLGGIFFLESISVILQVGYFKTTGKRIFLMAPIHHHFEKKGWPEPKVIVRFWIISIMLAVAALATLKLR